MDCAPVLRPLLESATLKAGVGIGDDLKALRELFSFEPQAIIDLGAALLHRNAQVAHAGIVEHQPVEPDLRVEDEANHSIITDVVGNHIQGRD